MISFAISAFASILADTDGIHPYTTEITSAGPKHVMIPNNMVIFPDLTIP